METQRLELGFKAPIPDAIVWLIQSLMCAFQMKIKYNNIINVRTKEFHLSIMTEFSVDCNQSVAGYV